MPSMYEILEAIRRFGPMTTAEIAVEFNVKSVQFVQGQLYALEGLGYIKRVGWKRSSKGMKTIVWALARDEQKLLQGYPTLYDIPFIKKKEERRIRLTGKGFKRWD